MRTDVAKKLLREPFYIVGVVGLSFCFTMREAVRFTAIRRVTTGIFIDDVLLSLARIIPLLVLLFLYLRSQTKTDQRTVGRPVLVGHSARLAVVAGCVTFGMALIFAKSMLSEHPIWLSPLAEIVLGLGNSFFILGWAEYLLALKRPVAFIMLVSSLILTGALQLLFTMFNIWISLPLLLLLPSVSMRCLTVSQRFVLEQPVLTADRRENDTYAQRSGAFLLCGIVGYIFIVAGLNSAWLASQDGNWFSILLQASAGVGTILGALFVFLGTDVFRSSKQPSSYTLLAAPLLVFALYLSTFLTDGWVVCFLVPLYISRRLIMLSIFITAFIQNSFIKSMRVFCLGFIALEAGVLLRDIVNALVPNTLFMSNVIIPLVLVALLIHMLITWVIGHRYETNPDANEWLNIFKTLHPTEKINQAVGNLTPSLPHITSSSQLYDSFSKQFDFTKREREVFIYLSQGRNAQYISDKLVIEKTTVKCHITHIYQKMGIKSQQQLMDAIEESVQTS